MRVNAADRVLLTGAGFTHNFGGPLARDVWAAILNNPAIHTYPELVDLLHGSFDYEELYHQVQDPKYGAAATSAFQQAVFDIYREIDRRSSPLAWGDDRVNVLRDVQDLVAAFRGEPGRPGFFFTLNQDLLVERSVGSFRCTPTMLGLGNDWEFSPEELPADLPARVLPTRVANRYLASSRGETLYYVKLHGSYNWRSVDGSKTMVIGTSKLAQIQCHPLLAWYHKIFHSVLCRPNCRLLVIGYSFRDSHINKAIATAIRRHGLEVHVVCPEAPEAFRAQLKQSHCGPTVWAGIRGYYPHTLSAIFPGIGLDESRKEAFCRHFFRPGTTCDAD